jgi:hypothetical protein
MMGTETRNGSRLAASVEAPQPTDQELFAATLTDLAFGIASDAKTLAKQQLQMLGAEVHEDLQRTKSSVLLLGTGVVLLAFGGLVLLSAAALLLAWAYPDLPLWAAAAIVGGVVAAVGIGFAYAGKRMFSSFNPLPDKTFRALTENLSWIASPRK